jgi:2-methylcitrate dehydratase
VLGLADYAKDIMSQDYSKIDDEIYDRVRLFHTDSVICGISAISMKTNAPTILRNEALEKYSVHVDKR